MTEILASVVRPQGVVLRPSLPESHSDVSSINQVGRAPEAAPGSLESLQLYQRMLNEFLAKHQIQGFFRLAELPTTFDGQMVLHSPDDVMAVLIKDESGKQTIRHCPRLFEEILLHEGVPFLEVPPVHFLDAELCIVNWPMDPGPPQLGEPTQELLMSMIMERESAKHQVPTCVVGAVADLHQLVAQAPPFEPIKLTQAQFAAIAAHYQQLETEFGGKQVPLSPNLIAPDSNVVTVDQFSASRKFYSVLTFHMADGSVRHRLVNRGEMIGDSDRLQEATCFLVTTVIDGEHHVVVAKMKRIIGQADGHEDTALEIIRSFSRKAISGTQFRYQNGEGESGISGETLIRYQTNGEARMKSDGALEDVEADVVMIALPETITFELANKQVDEPTKPIEQLAPTWLSLRTALEAIQQGELFTEAFSIALLATWFVKHQIVTLKPTTADGRNTAELGMLLETVQDWRTGGGKPTIWRGADQSGQALAGPLNPNNGINRRHHQVRHLEYQPGTQFQPDKPAEVRSLPELFAGIGTLQYDNLTIASTFKLLLQLGAVEIHWDKLKT